MNLDMVCPYDSFEKIQALKQKLTFHQPIQLPKDLTPYTIPLSFSPHYLIQLFPSLLLIPK
jgi:hypothetical protein